MTAPDAKPTNWFRWQGGNLILHVVVQPRADRDGFVGRHGDHLKIRLTAPPVDGQANERLIAFLAGQFGVPRSSVTLRRGQASRIKSLCIHSPRVLPPALAAAGLGPGTPRRG